MTRFRSSKNIFKVPNLEIFERLDYHDFYTRKSVLGSDFGAKIYLFLIFRGSFTGTKLLTCMLCQILRTFFSCLASPQKMWGVAFETVSVNKDFLFFFAFLSSKNLLEIFVNLFVCSDLYAYDKHTHQELKRALIIC